MCTRRVAKLVVTGNLPSVQVSTTGNTYTYLSGTPGSVNFNTSGNCTLYVDGTANTNIGGSSSGSNRIVYNHGQCTVSVRLARARRSSLPCALGDQACPSACGQGLPAQHLMSARPAAMLPLYMQLQGSCAFCS